MDPPPVVELRIFELGPNAGESKDITFHYNANFFLFATLELARPMAHGRVQTPAATATPVLTGMPVSGMAYLDRPAEAGYFLFPDLSVRHEGRYKLSFNLYEETKEEKYFDEETSESKGSPVGASFDWRMEVKSQAFCVYSAKKFPGLAESTALSRTVADQGCRVRIRRDVRMRRRDGKPSTSDYKKADDEYSHRPTARTPERQQPHDYRQRSASAASDHSRAPYPPEPQRRPSISESYATGPPPPPPPPGYGQSGHLGFGHTTPHAPQQYSDVQPPASPTTAYPNGHPSPFQAPQSHTYNYGSRPSSRSFGSAQGSFDERRASNGYVPPSPHAQEKHEDRRRPSQGYTTAPSPVRSSHSSKVDVRLPPIAQMFAGVDGFDKSRKQAGTTTIDNRIEPDPDPTPAPAPYANVPTGSKRRLEESTYTAPLYNGQRPKENDSVVTYDGLRLRNASGYMKQFAENTFIAEATEQVS